VYELLKNEDGTTQFVGDFMTREEAETRRAELIESDPLLEGLLTITSTSVSDRIQLSDRDVSVTWEKRSELIARLDNAGQKPAADELRSHRLLAEGHKRSMLALLDAWRAEVGDDALGMELLELRDALEHDVNPRSG
jgi:hypothetical protein